MEVSDVFIHIVNYFGTFTTLLFPNALLILVIDVMLASSFIPNALA
jgi:hypothetical protein